MVAKYGRIVGIAALVAAILWVVGLGFWNFSVSSAISAVESAVKAAPGGEQEIVVAEVLEDFTECGDRALPRLVETLDPGREVPYLAALTRFFGQRVKRIIPAFEIDDVRIVPSDPRAEVERKIGEVRSLWTRLEPRYRWWMWWTPDGLE